MRAENDAFPRRARPGVEHRVAVLTELRAEGVSRVDLNAAYVRVRPWPGVPLDIQAGRIPPVFGAFGRRTYANDRMLIGYPLAYQYLTSIRPNAVPATADDLLQMRGRGWRSSFPIGDPTPETGVPLVSGFRWDTGAQARWAPGRIETAVSVTTGTLSNPRIIDDNGRPQIAGRFAVQPVVGLVTGISAARGAWLDDDVPGESGQAQTAFGADAEYSRGYLVLRTEAGPLSAEVENSDPAYGRQGSLGVALETFDNKVGKIWKDCGTCFNSCYTRICLLYNYKRQAVG